MADNVDDQTAPQDPANSALPQDYGTPFQPADDVDAVLGDAHQLTDNKSDIDSTELYNDGLPAAAGAEEPRDPGVANYTPPDTNEEQ